MFSTNGYETLTFTMEPGVLQPVPEAQALQEAIVPLAFFTAEYQVVVTVMLFMFIPG